MFPGGHKLGEVGAAPDSEFGRKSVITGRARRFLLFFFLVVIAGESNELLFFLLGVLASLSRANHDV